MINLWTVVDWTLFTLFLVNTLYLLFFSLSALRGKPRKPEPAKALKRFAVFIAAYREDRVILKTVEECLKQNYPRELYDIIVISDHMQASTNAALNNLPVTLLQVDFLESSNTKSLKEALKCLDADRYDIALILDADNRVNTSYLNDLNDAFARPGVEVVQTHRIAKNLNTGMAYLDAISEEINNSIFRLGHVNAGLSAALIGSGMAFTYSLFRDAMMKNTSVGGFDKVLEMDLLNRGIFFHYLPDTYVMDEKVQHLHSFYHQRRRWLSAQYYNIGIFLRHLPAAFRHHNLDFCDKLFQQLALSRLLLVGFMTVICLVHTFVAPDGSIKWWLLLALLLLTLLVAIPSYLRRRRRFFRAIFLVPYSFILMFLNLFRLKKANSTFIHTEHSEEA